MAQSLEKDDLENGTHPSPTNAPEESEIPKSKTTNGAVQRSTVKRKPSVKKRRVKKRENGTAKQDRNALIKYGSLLLLVAQMVGLVLLMRYSRTQPEKEGELYLASTAVFMMEVMKFVICTLVIFYQCNCSMKALFSELYTHVWMSPYEVLKLCVPSLLYTVQNNLLYLALTNLDAATYQVCYQLKILTTAMFSVVLLGRRFSAFKWLALITLTVGVAIVEISGSSEDPNTSDKQNRYVGLIAVLCAACTSGFAGVYFEKILKGSTTSLWLRNIQMSLPSIIIAYITVFLRDGPEVASKGFFTGYSSTVWTVVTVQAAGGLIVAVVVKYADNVLKVFAASFSIIVSCIISSLLFNFRPNLSFLFGAFLVVFATGMYSYPEDKLQGGRKMLLPFNRSNKMGARRSHLVL